jgi:hypothetical protein
LGYNAIGRNETKRDKLFQLKNEKGFNVDMKAYVEDRLFMVNNFQTFFDINIKLKPKISQDNFNILRLKICPVKYFLFDYYLSFNNC